MKYCIKCGSKIEERDEFCESCGYKIDTSSTASASVSPIISEKVEQASKEAGLPKKLFIIPIVFVIFLGVILSVVMTGKKSPDTTSNKKPPIEITNPEYLKNPSVYQVDYDNKISSQIPTNKPLWIEELGGVTITISYPIAKAGEKIIVIKRLAIPGLGYETSDEYKVSECKRELAGDFMRKNLLHREVYLVPGSPDYENLGSRLLMPDSNKKDMLDIATFIVRNGYAFVDLGGYSPDVFMGIYSFPYPYQYKKDLKDELEVARLAKRGYWGTCQKSEK